MQAGVAGKGKKDRVVPVGRRALHWIEKYLEVTRPRLFVNLDEHALFLTGYGERFSAGYVGNWVRRTMDKADIGRTGSPTCARRIANVTHENEITGDPDACRGHPRERDECH